MQLADRVEAIFKLVLPAIVRLSQSLAPKRSGFAVWQRPLWILLCMPAEDGKLGGKTASHVTPVSRLNYDGVLEFISL